MKHPLEESLPNVTWTVYNGTNTPRHWDCDSKVKKYGLAEECALSVSQDGKFEFHTHKSGAVIYLIKKQDASTLKMAGAPASGRVEFFSDYFELTQDLYFVLKTMGMEEPKVRVAHLVRNE